MLLFWVQNFKNPLLPLSVCNPLSDLWKAEPLAVSPSYLWTTKTNGKSTVRNLKKPRPIIPWSSCHEHYPKSG